jgi:RHS repeat-associated protein
MTVLRYVLPLHHAATLSPILRARRLLAALLLTAATGAAMACPTDGGPTCALSGQSPASQPATASVNVGAGNPINVMTGNKYQREDDLPALPGVLGLEIVRQYNSRFSGPGAMPGVVGRGWKLSYETELAVAGDTIQVFQADGSSFMFRRDLVNQAVANGDDPASGSIAIRRNLAGRDEYLWRWANGRELSFDQRGKLVQIKAATGEIVSLLYDAQGLLVKVTDPQGRSLRLAYLDRQQAARGDRFRGVQHIDSPVGRFSYEYGNPVPKGAAIDQLHLLANLARVRYPAAGEGRQYHYEDAGHPTYLTGISIEGQGEGGKPLVQRYATFGYQADGRAVLSTHANDVDKVTLAFERPGLTVVTNSLGQQTSYRYATVAGDYRLLEVRGAGCALCGPSNQRYGYDKLGRLVETTKLDRDGAALEATRTELDYYGRPRRSTRVLYRGGKAGEPQLLSRYEYNGSSPAPSLIARPSVVPGRELVTEIAYGAATGTLPLRIVERGYVPTFDGKGVADTVIRTVAYRYNATGQRIETDGPLPNAAKAPGPANSDITRVQYEPRSHLASRTTAPGNIVTAVQERDAALRPTRLRTSDGYRAQTTSIRYNWRSQPVDIMVEAVLLDPAGAEIAGSKLARTLRYQYDPAGRLAAITMPGNLTTRLGYDAAGRLVQRVLPDGSRLTSEQDTEGRLLAEARYADAGPGAAPLSLSRFQYDEEGRLQQVRDSVGVVGKLEYTNADQVARLTNALGAATQFDYDDNGLLVARIDAADSADAATRRLTRDSHGQPTLLEDANGVATTRRYDDFGRKVAEVSPDRGTVLFRHDAAGHVLARIDDGGSVTRYSYDHAGRLTDIGADDQHGLVTYRYEGRHLAEMASTTDGRLQHAVERTQYRQDGFGQVTQERRWVARVDQFLPVDGIRKVAAREGAWPGISFVTENRYDEAGRLVAQRLPDGHSLEYRYATADQDAVRAGQLSAVLFDERIIVGAIERTEAGGLTGYTMSNGVRQQLVSDGRGRVAELLAQAGGMRPNEGTVARWWRQLLGALAPERRPALVYRQSNRYDLADRLERIVRQQGGAASAERVERFDYDRLNRLTGTEQSGAPAIRWQYDQGGNRVSEQSARGELDYHYQAGSNRLVGLTSSTPQLGQAAWLYHDSGVPLAQLGNGRGLTLASATTANQAATDRRIVYNSARRPLAVYGANGSLVARYAYNSLGERIAKTVFDTPGAAGRTSYSLYRDQRLAAEADADGRITAHYVYLYGKPVAKIEMSQASDAGGRIWSLLRSAGSGANDSSTVAGVYAIHTDHLGTPQVVTDDQARVVWQASTTPFGLATISYAAVLDGHRFEMNLRLPGQVYDAETGLNQNYYRDYDPRLGRYTSADPLGLDGGANPYAYVDGNPLTKSDPLGLYEQDVHYYITYFLARVAGVDARMAYLMATGAQYIDDNPITQPMSDSYFDSAWQIVTKNAMVRNRLARYHFTETDADDKTQDEATRYIDPDNAQLRRLSTAAGNATSLGSECAGAIMFGEYLHAFEDTFAHRRYDNAPVGINGGLGHLFYGHMPDHTYNEDQLLGHDWHYNEDRTLEMEKEVYNKLLTTWGNKAVVHSWDEIKDLMVEFNKQPENSQSTNNFRGKSEKIKKLNERLNAWDYQFVGVDGKTDELDLKKAGSGQYSEAVGKANRADFYKYNSDGTGHKANDAFSSDDSSFDGVILK